MIFSRVSPPDMGELSRRLGNALASIVNCKLT
jgi:hypothetical protein